jgi:hypothetical protein
LDLDTVTLYQLYKYAAKRPEAAALRQALVPPQGGGELNAFLANRAHGWRRAFDFGPIKGVNPPGAEDDVGLVKTSNDHRNKANDKMFAYFLSTDGVGASFHYKRPKRRPVFWKPTDVPIGPKTRVYGADPGVIDLAVLTTRCHMPCQNVGQPAEVEETWHLSAKEWHELSFHNKADARRRRHHLANPQIKDFERGITTSKTTFVAVYLHHLDTVLPNTDPLFDFYERERSLRWTTYRWTQRAFHNFCLRAKGNPRAKREDVVIAYGAGSFGHTARGRRAVPVKTFRRKLQQYATVVLVGEFRTSRVCSRMCYHEDSLVPPPQPAPAPPEPPDPPDPPVPAGQAQGAQNERFLKPVRGQRDAFGGDGPSLHSVRYCKSCRTMWNRDVNASRNILHTFWWVRQTHGQRPPAFARPPPAQGDIALGANPAEAGPEA